jgi:WhiB family redox-sensing transcriptional regulator
VILICREHAVRTREPHGVWGGLSPKERKQQRWLYS